MMSPRSATAYAPATVANLGPGFDILGLALASPGDTVTVSASNVPGVSIEHIEGDHGLLPRDPAKNTACVAAHHVLRTIAPGAGLKLRLGKGLPLASGLGSSSASAAAGAVAVNAFFGNPLSRADLLPACVEAEAVVSGRHADNVAPALLGGIVLVTGITPETIYRLPVPEGLHLAVVTPHVEVPTSKARAALPDQVALPLLVQQSGQIALLIHALYQGDVHLLAQAISGDRIIEPARAHLMPHLRQAQAEAANAGSLATFISGAGPTLCAICDSRTAAETVTDRLSKFYASMNLPTTTQATTVSHSGAQVLQMD